MAMTLEELENLKKQLTASLLSSSQVIQFGERRIERRSVAEIRKALEWVDQEIDEITGTGGLKRISRVTTSKAL
jgi:hypothetical protein